MDNFCCSTDFYRTKELLYIFFAPSKLYVLEEIPWNILCLFQTRKETVFSCEKFYWFALVRWLREERRKKGKDREGRKEGKEGRREGARKERRIEWEKEQRNKNDKGCEKEKSNPNWSSGMKSKWLWIHITWLAYKLHPHVSSHLKTLSLNPCNFFSLRCVSDFIRSKVTSVFPERAFCQDKKLSASTVLPAHVSFTLESSCCHDTGDAGIMFPRIKPYSLKVCDPSETHQMDVLLMYWSCVSCIRNLSHPYVAPCWYLCSCFDMKIAILFSKTALTNKSERMCKALNTGPST